MKFDEIASILDGVPFMTLAQARAMYDHVLETEPREILELGTAHGVSACYMAAALDEIGAGRITSLEHATASYNPPPEAQLEAAGLADRVTIIRRGDSSYDWFLREQIVERSDGDGNCAPLYDLCYIDGAHEFTIDGLAVILAERLLNDGGWLVLDDVTWTFASEGWSGEAFRLSEAERREAHVRAVVDVIVRPHPSFTDVRLAPDLDWAWARKAPGAERKLTVKNSRSMPAAALLRLRERRRRGARR
jgi:predicted O-methyltransferase YrrM